ncbi:ABC transporter permease subunit [Streptomyces morookaense]|uniref:ABC transporter permease n=1 Tax=Streptomyces morookaense TaxID=1970 RepID=UPI00340FD8D4
MSATADALPKSSAPAPGRRGRRLLRGMTWVVWRQHRIVFLVFLTAAVVMSAGMAWQRSDVMEFLRHPSGTDFQEWFDSDLDGMSRILRLVPVFVGVFIGAPLIAADRERGTARLVTTQSVTRTRWLVTKAAMALLVTVVCTALMSAAFTWWWKPVHAYFNGGNWASGAVFDATGPMPVALALFHLALGTAIGVLVRRAVPAMGLTFVCSAVLGLVWDRYRLAFGTPRTVTAPLGGSYPERPKGSAYHDSWTVGMDGKLHGSGACSHYAERTPELCWAHTGIVAKRIDYFGFDQMPGMQWAAAAVLVAVAAVVLGTALWWAARRAL